MKIDKKLIKELVDHLAEFNLTELEFNFDNAVSLVSSSTDFDNWINEVVFDLANFRGDSKGKALGKDSEVAKKSGVKDDKGAVSGDDGTAG